VSIIQSHLTGISGFLPYFKIEYVNATDLLVIYQVDYNPKRKVYRHVFSRGGFTLLQATKAVRENRGIAQLCFQTSALEGVRVSVTPRPVSTPGKDPVPIVQEAGWAPGPVWKGEENLAPTGIRSPDRPVRSQSLYRMSYPTHMS
jgi:hypothetical protein